MKKTFVGTMGFTTVLLLAVLSADVTLAQSRFAPYARRGEKTGTSDDNGQTIAAALLPHARGDELRDRAAE